MVKPPNDSLTVLKRAGVAGSNIINIYKCSVRSFILAYAVPAWQDIPETLSVVLTNKVKTNSRYFVGVFSKTITLLALVGYEIIIANSSLRAWLPTTISLHTRTRGIIVKSPVYPCISSTIEYPVILCNILFTHVNSSILYTMFILFTHAHPRTVDSMTIYKIVKFVIKKTSYAKLAAFPFNICLGTIDEV